MENIVRLQHSALETFDECQEMIRNARIWEQEGALYEDEPRERREIVNQMELSLLRCLVHLFMVRQGHDGEVVISRNMVGGFFWRHPKSGYHGGLLFHKNHSIEDATVGTWSIHT